MAVDRFGGSLRRPLKGLRGKAGIPGIVDFSRWLPNTILNSLQNNDEIACFFIEKENDIHRKDGDIVKWNSRSSNYGLSAEKPSRNLVRLANGREALSFKNNRYISDDIFFFPNHLNTYGFICITFRSTGNGKQTIVSNFQEDTEKYFHEINVTETEIEIWGIEQKKSKCVTIQHRSRGWTTLYIEYIALKSVTECRYIINNDPHCNGSFTFDTYDEMMSGFSLGSRYDNTKFFQGDVASLEMYHVQQKGGQSFPPCLKELVINNQLIT